jgi:hypothetical protein
LNLGSDPDPDYAIPCLSTDFNGFQTRNDPPRAEQAENVYAAVRRSRMKRWCRGSDKAERESKEKWEKESAKEMNFKVFLVSVSDKDPSDEFL